MVDLIDLEQARSTVLGAVTPLATEPVELERALGRVLAEDVTSPLDLPPFDSSAMDGFAVRAGDAAELAVDGEARAGAPALQALGPGAAIRISTGAPVPEGADAVVPVERTQPGHDGRVQVPRTKPGANIRRAGEDVRAGDLVLKAGTPLGPAELGMLASLGRASASCSRRPRVSLVVTGDELAEPGEELGPGRIYGSNATALTGQLALLGAEVAGRRTVGDSFEDTRAALAAALEEADVVLASGGVSVGPHDHVKPALADLGVEERFWGVKLKPGKPTWFGTLGDKLVLGLPGNPVSAMVCLQLFGVPALRALQGADPAPRRSTAALAQAVRLSPDRAQAVRCRLDGEGRALPTGDQGSHRMSSMLGADGLAIVPPGEGELAAGERVTVEALGWRP